MCHEFNGLDALQLVDIKEPQLQPNTVRVMVRACGVNFADSLITSGAYQYTPTLPFIPGFEIAGDIIEIGSEVNTKQLDIGTRIIAVIPYGGYAEQVVVPANRCFTIPSNMSYEHGAAFPITFGTSHIALCHRAMLSPGEMLIVHGAAGGVGLTAVAIGNYLGATVLATASTQEKLNLAKQYGAHLLVNPNEDNLTSIVMAATNGYGANVVYDNVGGNLFHSSMSSLAFEGRLLIIGFASGNIPNIKANYLLVKNINIIGLNWPAYIVHRPEILTRSITTLIQWYNIGVIKPYISKVYTLFDAIEAMKEVRDRRSSGKIVITC